MESKLLEIVRENLPEQTAGEMRKYIEEAEQAKRDLVYSKTSLEDEQLKNTKLNTQILSLKDDILALTKIKNEYSGRKKAIKDKEIEIEKRELRQEILEIKASEAEKRSYDIKELTGIVFRNKTLVTKSVDTPMVTKSYSTSYDNNGNQTSYPVSECVEQHNTTTETTTENE